MPKKIRELKEMLLSAGFTWRPGKGSHTNWFHPGAERLTLSGKDGSDAKRYQEQEVAKRLAQVALYREEQASKEEEQ
jgi:predicted RNA binding protein YcfA (HicA-like mRNA interferase family)